MNNKSKTIEFKQGFIKEFTHGKQKCKCSREDCPVQSSHEIEIFLLVAPKKHIEKSDAPPFLDKDTEHLFFLEHYHNELFSNYDYTSARFVLISDVQYYCIPLCVCSKHFLEVLKLLDCKVSDAMYALL